MRRWLPVLVGLALLGAGLVGPAQATTRTPTEFHYGIVAGEGPAAPSGSRFDYFATLVDDTQHPVAGASVSLQVRPYGSSTYVARATGLTGADGAISLSVVLTRSSSIRWSWGGDAVHAGSTSSSYLESVATRVAAHAQDSTLAGRQKLVVLGSTLPSKPGVRVGLWQGDIPAGLISGRRPIRIATALVRSDGTFRLTATFAHPGSKRLYVRVNAASGNAVGYSRYLRIKVR